MFSEIEFEWTVLVQPDAMKSSAHIQRAVILTLLKDFNDVKCTASHGYHVAITSLENIGEGRLWERRGCAAFPVRFKCLVFNLFPHEYVLAVVTEAQPSGIISQCGPIERVFVAQKYLKEYEFLSTEVDDNLAVTKWRSILNGTTVKKGDVIRVKVLGTNWEPKQRALHVVGSILGDYAGRDDRWPEKKGKETATANCGGNSPQQAQATANCGGNSPQQAGAADDDGWGDPVTKEDDMGASGWGASDTNEDNVGSGWA